MYIDIANLGEGNGYPLQYSGLDNPVDCIVHGVAKSQTQLSNFHTHIANSMENSLEVPQKKIKLPYNMPSNPTPGHILRENHKSKRYMYTSVYCSTIYNCQDMEAT